MKTKQLILLFLVVLAVATSACAGPLVCWIDGYVFYEDGNPADSGINITASLEDTFGLASGAVATKHTQTVGGPPTCDFCNNYFEVAFDHLDDCDYGEPLEIIVSDGVNSGRKASTLRAPPDNVENVVIVRGETAESSFLEEPAVKASILLHFCDIDGYVYKRQMLEIDDFAQLDVTLTHVRTKEKELRKLFTSAGPPPSSKKGYYSVSFDECSQGDIVTITADDGSYYGSRIYSIDLSEQKEYDVVLEKKKSVSTKEELDTLYYGTEGVGEEIILLESPKNLEQSMYKAVFIVIILSCIAWFFIYLDERKRGKTIGKES